MYNLTENQKNILIWIVRQVRSGNLPEDFHFIYTGAGKIHYRGKGIGKIEDSPFLSIGIMKALMASNLILFEEKGEEIVSYRCTLLGNAYRAVDTNFAEEIEDKNTQSFISVFGKPNKNYVYDLFVLMPFMPELNGVYHNHIKKVADSLNLSIACADDFFSQKSIIEEIWSAIAQASILIADGTHKNPNVFYEIGIAHAIGKPVILITQNHDDIPFDLRHRRYIPYKPSEMDEFETKLSKTISETLKDLNSSIKPNHNETPVN